MATRDDLEQSKFNNSKVLNFKINQSPQANQIIRIVFFIRNRCAQICRQHVCRVTNRRCCVRM